MSHLPPNSTPQHQSFNQLRDAALFMGGMAGVFHETVLQTGERPTLLILFAAMMGLPAFLRADQLRSRGWTPPEIEPSKTGTGDSSADDQRNRE